MTKTIRIETLEKQTFVIEFHHTEGNCWVCSFPYRFEQSIKDATRYNDVAYQEELTGNIIWESGSLERMMNFIAIYIGMSEA